MKLAMQLPHMRLVREFIVLQLAQEAACSESLISKLQHGAASTIAVHASFGFRRLFNLEVRSQKT
jgi:hypothetical protein